MKRLLLSLCLLGLLATPARAYQLRAGETTNALVLPADARIGEEALWAAQRIDVQGTADRDLWLLATGAVRFDGAAGGDLRVFAASATIGGEARGNLLAYANGLQLTTNSAVRGEVALFGADLICEGAVDGNARLFARSVTLGGRWGGDVRIYANEIRISPGTQIAGNLAYASSKPLVYDSSVSIGGTVEPIQIAAPDNPARSRFALHGYLFLAALLVGMPFVGFFPMVAGGAVRKLRLSPWRALFAGLAVILGGPFLIAFAIVTVVGLPLALMLAALYGALLYLSHVVVALWLGHLLLRAPGPQTFSRVLSALATGLFILYFAAALPGVASFLLFPVVVLGGGALVLAFLQRPFIPIAMPPPPPLPKKPESPEHPE